MTRDGSIHFVDVTTFESERRTVCGARTPDVQWTTLRRVATCAKCLLLAAALRGDAPAATPPEG